jgi:hypothetical protein
MASLLKRWLLVVTAVTALPLHAQPTSLATLNIEVAHQAGSKGELTAKYPDLPVVTKALKTPVRLQIDKGQEARVVIVDRNPLLFAYSSKASTAPSAGMEAILAFANALAAKGSVFAAATPAPEAAGLEKNLLSAVFNREAPKICASFTVDGLDVVKFRKEVKDVSEWLRSIGGLIDKTIDPATVAGAKETVAGWSLSETGTSLTADTQHFSAMIQGMMDGRDIRFECILNDDNGADRGFVKADAQPIELMVETPAQKDPAKKTPAKKTPVPQQCTVPTENCWPELMEPRKILRFLFEFRSEISQLSSGVATLEEFAKAMSAVNTPGDPQATVAFDPAQETTIALAVTASDRFAAFLSKEAVKYQSSRLAEYSITFFPRERYHPKFAPSAIYSFVPDPKFSVHEKPGGELVIQKTSENYSALSVAAMLNITRDADFGYGFQPFLQLGISPIKDKTAILLGAGFDGFGKINLALGAIYQQVGKLKAGLSEGQVLESADDLKTDTEFRVGFYLQVGLSLGK